MRTVKRRIARRVGFEKCLIPLERVKDTKYSLITYTFVTKIMITLIIDIFIVLYHALLKAVLHMTNAIQLYVQLSRWKNNISNCSNVFYYEHN